MSCQAAMLILRPRCWRFLEFNQRLQWTGAFCPKRCGMSHRSKRKRKCWNRRKNFQPEHGVSISRFRGSVRRSIWMKATASSPPRPPGSREKPDTRGRPEISELALILLARGRMKQLIPSTLRADMETMAIIQPGCPSERPIRKILDRLAILDETEAMKQLIRLTILFCACAALALTAVAGPESLPSGKEMKQVAPAPPPECDFTWTGFYAGFNGGYGWGNGDTHFHPLPDPATFLDLEPPSLSPDPSGFIGGGQIGFNWQWNKWLVLGVETDFQGSDMEGSDTRFHFNDI